MTALQGFVWLLCMQSLGELTSKGLGLSIPGPVIGMLFMLGSLQSQRIRTPVAACADYLLSHLSLLFVPVGVGVMAHLGLISEFGFRMLLVVVLSTWVAMIVTALVLQHLDREPGDG